MKIAVDFDGTIVEHKYPEIGTEIPFAFQTLKMLQAKGHLLVLWTYRSGELLQAAVDFCKANGIEFYAINSDFPGEDWDSSKSRKINCDLYIDDRNIGGMLSWGEIYQLIHPDSGNTMYIQHQKKKWFWNK